MSEKVMAPPADPQAIPRGLRESVEALSARVRDLEKRLEKVESKLHARRRSHIFPRGRIEGKSYSYGGELPPKELLEKGRASSSE